MESTSHLTTDVIIVGGGPVGLVAAMDLARRGVRSIVIEHRAYLEAPNVKCNHVSSRTMERFRQLGIAESIRDGGLPSDYPHDVVFATAFTGTELSRISIPSPDDRRSGSGKGPDTTWETPEPAHRINQHFMEPILMHAAAAQENITLLFEHDFSEFEQHVDSVTASVRSLVTGETITLRGEYLIGADGGRSFVRKSIGATLEGDGVLQHVQSTHIRAPKLYSTSTVDPAWGYYTFNKRRSGHVYAIDGQEKFLVHNHLTHEEFESGNIDRDTAIRDILGVDADFEYEIISEEDWVARRLVASSFHEDRVFLAGDAAHLWVPYAGYGMNAGIADVLNLTWTLGSVFAGWAAPEILRAYESERKPITEQVSHFVMRHQQKLSRDEIPELIEAETAEGDKARAQFAKHVYDLNVQQFAAEGLNFGYHYSDSPIIAYDGETAPDYSMGSYIPSTVPGCRAPHFWLEPGVSLYDRLGMGYTLLAFTELGSIAPLIETARNEGVPITVIEVPQGIAPRVYDRKFVLCRDDQHIVWRGDSAPEDVQALVSQLRGL